MAFCTNCGSEINSRFCHSCGADNGEPQAAVSIPQETVISQPTEFKATSRCGRLEIDEINGCWRVLRPSENPFKKKHTFWKVMLAIFTSGISLVISAAVKASENKRSPCYTYDQLLSYELLENNTALVTGGVGGALVGAVLGGGYGALLGSIAANRQTNIIVESMVLKISVDDFKNPLIMLPIITSATYTDSAKYQNAVGNAQRMLSMLDVISHRS